MPTTHGTPATECGTGAGTGTYTRRSVRRPQRRAPEDTPVPPPRPMAHEGHGGWGWGTKGEGGAPDAELAVDEAVDGEDFAFVVRALLVCRERGGGGTRG